VLPQPIGIPLCLLLPVKLLVVVQMEVNSVIKAQMLLLTKDK